VDFCVINDAKIPIFGAALGVCRVKNRLIGDFGDFMREAQQTPRAACGTFPVPDAWRPAGSFNSWLEGFNFVTST
jgi:hypothetical protein